MRWTHAPGSRLERTSEAVDWPGNPRGEHVSAPCPGCGTLNKPWCARFRRGRVIEGRFWTRDPDEWLTKSVKLPDTLGGEYVLRSIARYRCQRCRFRYDRDWWSGPLDEAHYDEFCAE